MNLIHRFQNSKEAKNASWLIAGRVVRMLISFVVSILTVRYLGPSNYGLISYVMAYATFFSAFCTLGINSVIIKDFHDFPNQTGQAIGSSILCRIVSCFFSAIAMVGVVYFVDGNDTTTIVIAILCSSSLVFTAFDTINYWFQSKYMSRITAIISLVAYIILSIYKVVLLILQKDVIWFAVENILDNGIIALGLMIAYKKFSGPKLSFSFVTLKRILSKSKYYILSALLIVIYTQTDKLMLKQMLNEVEVGYYSVATTICGMWVFVLQAIIDSIYPTIIMLHDKDYELYKKKNRQLYAIVFYCSVFVSIIFLFFGGFIIRILYGEAYEGSVAPLKIVTWYIAFSYLGVSRNAWIVSENKQKYLIVIYVSAAVFNVVANAILIPQNGASGASVATLITQIFTSIILPFVIKGLRPNSILMLEAITLRGVFKKRK